MHGAQVCRVPDGGRDEAACCARAWRQHEPAGEAPSPHHPRQPAGLCLFQDSARDGTCGSRHVAPMQRGSGEPGKARCLACCTAFHFGQASAWSFWRAEARRQAWTKHLVPPAKSHAEASPKGHAVPMEGHIAVSCIHISNLVSVKRTVDCQDYSAVQLQLHNLPTDVQGQPDWHGGGTISKPA